MMIVHHDQFETIYKKLPLSEYSCVLCQIKQYHIYEVLKGITYCNDLMEHLLRQGNTLLHTSEYMVGLHRGEFLCILKTQHPNVILRTLFQLDDLCDVSFSFGIHILHTPLDYFHMVLRCEHALKTDPDVHKHTTSYAFSDDDEYQKSQQHCYIQSMLEDALKKEEFALYIQPKVDTNKEVIVGGEALIRWMHQGLQIPLCDFMPIADQNAFIRNIDLFVFEEVCRFLYDNMQRNKPQVMISVNISRPSYEDQFHYLRCIQSILLRYPHVEKYLELELSEHIIDTNEKMDQFLKRLRSFGIHISIDDFGSGSSSLSQLFKMNVDTIKLDQSFFQHPFHNRQAFVITNIVKMLKELGFQIIAEGVETKEYVDFLKTIRCDQIQGFYYYKPMKLSEFQEIIRKDSEH